MCSWSSLRLLLVSVPPGLCLLTSTLCPILSGEWGVQCLGIASSSTWHSLDEFRPLALATELARKSLRKSPQRGGLFNLHLSLVVTSLHGVSSSISSMFAFDSLQGFVSRLRFGRPLLGLSWPRRFGCARSQFFIRFFTFFLRPTCFLSSLRSPPGVFLVSSFAFLGFCFYLFLLAFLSPTVQLFLSRCDRLRQDLARFWGVLLRCLCCVFA